MIQIFTGGYGPGASLVLDELYRDRKRVFIDRLKWDLPITAGEFEIDEFDTEHAVYLVSASETGDHLGSFRFLPTNHSHLLGSLFADLCDGPVPRGEDILEITRGCISPRLRAAERLRVRNRLITAAVQYGVLRGITSFTCVADVSWLKQILVMGWQCEPLGTPRLVEGVATGALRIAISRHTLEQLRRGGTYAASSLVVADFDTPLAA